MCESNFKFSYGSFIIQFYTQRVELREARSANMLLLRIQEKDGPQFPFPYLHSHSVFTQCPSINLMHTMTFQIICLSCLPQTDPVTKHYNPNLPYKSQLSQDMVANLSKH